QRQLDAARARIAELEGKPPTPLPVKPTLTATAEADGLRLAWTNATRVHIIPTKGRHLPAYTVDVAATIGADVVPWQTLREQWDGFGPGWELSAWASSGNVASAEVAVVVPQPTIPAEPKEPTPGFVNARVITDAAEAQRVLRSAGSEPLIIRIPGTVRIPL